jgi:hypothetical protein
MKIMIQLEKYKGTGSRHTCPNCNHKGEFTRFVGNDGNYIAANVGICNRLSKCGYRYTAKEYYADNPTTSKFVTARPGKSEQIKVRNSHSESVSFDVIPPEHLTATLGDYDRNVFAQFLFNLFPDDTDAVRNVLKSYLVGTYKTYTCFPSIDRLSRICRAKLIRFNPVTGKRLKDIYGTSSLPAKLRLKKDFNYKQIFFGEHLLERDTIKPVAIVEAEKTAIIASLCMPQFIWLATGSKQWLKADRLQPFENRQVILYPDADGFNQWERVASEASCRGLIVKTSALIENFATDEQKQNQYDLADYLIEQQQEINRSNQTIDQYNTELEIVLNDESLLADFETILNEQKAVMIIDSGLSETEAESCVSTEENIRRIVSSLGIHEQKGEK